jgi:hypothetical protein
VPRSVLSDREARLADFKASYDRPIRERIRRGFIHTFKPGLDDGPPIRSWKTTAEYRQWCEENLEPWLGYCSPEKVKEALREIEAHEDCD